MNSDNDLICGLNGLQTCIECAGKRHICTSRVDDECADWILGSTDGVNFWSRKIAKEDYHNLHKKHSLSSEQYNDVIKSSFLHGNIEVSIIAQRLKVVFEDVDHTIRLPFDLYETTSLEKSTETKHLLFSMMDRITEQEKALKETKDQLSNMEKPTKNTQQNKTSIFGELESKRAKRSAPKQLKGQSVINPGSKRVKKAKGIVFE